MSRSYLEWESGKAPLNISPDSVVSLCDIRREVGELGWESLNGVGA